LRQLDRPSVLGLFDEAGRPFYVILLGLDSQTATLRQGGSTQQISLLNLSKQWRGEFATLWRAPAELSGKSLSPAMLSWLDEQLAKAFAEPPSPGAHKYDALMRARVAAFQRAQGLESDGQVGPITLMQLMRAAGSVEPRLQLVQSIPARSPSAAANQ
jgi:general secretion pathway protein A